MCAEDFNVSRRTGFRCWFPGLQGLSFRQWFLICSSLCAVKISASAVELVLVLISVCAATQFSSMISHSPLKISTPAVELGFSDDFWVCGDAVFVNDFWFCSSLCAEKISLSVVELVSGDDFWVCNDVVFVNDFSFCSSLCALKISTPAVELGFSDDF
jgi:hypothetical protein